MAFPQRFSLDGDGWQLYYLLPNEWWWRKVWEAESPVVPWCRASCDRLGRIRHSGRRPASSGLL